MLSIFAHIFLTSVCRETASSFLEIPGNINAMEGGPVTMLWRHSETESKACYWEFDDFDPVLRPKFVLYYSEAGGKGVGDHGIGWDFTNQEYPCLGGITKARTTKGDAGSYKMGVGKIHSRKSILYLYNVTNLIYSVRIVDVVYNGTAENTTAIVLPVQNLTDPVDMFYPVSVWINDRFPPNTNISVTLENMEINVDSLRCDLKRQCETNLTYNDTSDSNWIVLFAVLVAIDTGLWEYPNLVIEQWFVKYPEENIIQVFAIGIASFTLSVLMILSLICVLLERRNQRCSRAEISPTPLLTRQPPDYTSAEVIQTYQGGESSIHYQEGVGLNPGALFFTPGAVAVCPRTHSTIVTDINEDKVHVLNHNLQQESVFGGSGNAEGQYSQPIGIAVNSRGLVFVADRWNHRIQVVTRGGNVQMVLTPERWNMQEFDPTDIAIDSTDKIYICDCSNKRIIILHADYTFANLIPCTDNTQGLLQPEYIAVSKGNLALTDTKGNVYLLNHDGSDVRNIYHETTSPAASHPIPCDHCRGLVFDGQGYLVVTDSMFSGLLHIWKGEEGNTERACNGILTLPRAVGLTTDGDLLVCDDTRLVKLLIPKICE